MRNDDKRFDEITARRVARYFDALRDLGEKVDHTARIALMREQYPPEERHVLDRAKAILDRPLARPVHA